MRPTFDAFLAQVETLSSEQARQLAEIARVPDWRRDRDVGNFLPVLLPFRQMGYKQIALEDMARTEAALDEARRIVGPDAVEAATRQALQTIAELRISWPGMRLHGPVRLVMWASLGVAGILLILRPTTSDPAILVPFILLLSLAALSWLAGYLLPPSEGDLRDVVEHAAVAHAAGSSLGEEPFEQLAGGWYAVLAGRWRRGRRPYGLWGCLIASVVALILLGVVLEVTGTGK